MTLGQALAGKTVPADIRETLVLVDIRHHSFDGLMRQGQLVVHQDLADDARSIFEILFNLQFPIAKIIPIVAYDWSDTASMAANNTSAFNYRFIAGTEKLSQHAFGRAIDINPVQNPYIRRDGVIMPANAIYDPNVAGSITPSIADIFRSRGWEWGGDWKHKDWQHFQKPL